MKCLRPSLACEILFWEASWVSPYFRPAQLERVKWFLWHGNVGRALDTIDDVEGELDLLPQVGESRKKLLKAVREFSGYIEANQNFIPNYGDRYRHGEKISTAFAESAVNQVVSKRMVNLEGALPGKHEATCVDQLADSFSFHQASE